MRRRQEFKTLLRRFVADYEKHVVFTQFVNGYPDAVRRASRLDVDAEAAGEAGRNPTTGVWKLTESIRRVE